MLTKIKQLAIARKGRYMAAVTALAFSMASIGAFVMPRTASATTGKSIYECAAEQRLIQKGSVGVCVKALQYFYAYIMEWGLKIDGIFGDQTALVTAYYQQYSGLSVDGKVGSNTWNKISYHCSTPYSPYKAWVCSAPRYYP